MIASSQEKQQPSSAELLAAKLAQVKNTDKQAAAASNEGREGQSAVSEEGQKETVTRTLSPGMKCAPCSSEPSDNSQDSEFLQGSNWLLANKRRYCLFDAANCRSGDLCIYAHAREELMDSLTEEEERAFIVDNPDSFYMNRFKTIWCPYRTKHDWQVCPYMHNYQDARRPVAMGYTSKICPDWAASNKSDSYLNRCPRGFTCPMVHGSKELLYHPDFYKTTRCLDWGKGSLANSCPRGRYCSFHHGTEDQRVVKQADKVKECTTVQEMNADALSPDFHIPVHIPFTDQALPSKDENKQNHKTRRSKKAAKVNKENVAFTVTASTDKIPTPSKQRNNSKNANGKKGKHQRAAEHPKGRAVKFSQRVRPDRVSYGPVDFSTCTNMPSMSQFIPPAFMVPQGAPQYGQFGNMMMSPNGNNDASFKKRHVSSTVSTHTFQVPIQCFQALGIDSDMGSVRISPSELDPDSKNCSPVMMGQHAPSKSDPSKLDMPGAMAWPDSPSGQFNQHSPQWVFVPNSGWMPPIPDGEPSSADILAAKLAGQQNRGNPAAGGNSNIEIIGLNNETKMDLATFKDEEPEQNVNDLFRGVSEERSVQKVLKKIDSTASVGSVGKRLQSGEMKWSDVPPTPDRMASKPRKTWGKPV